jgi:hypothetical protein
MKNLFRQALPGMRVKPRGTIRSAASAKQQSPGRKPWERREHERSPERAAQAVNLFTSIIDFFALLIENDLQKPVSPLQAFFPFVLTQGSGRFATSALGFTAPRFQR